MGKVDGSVVRWVQGAVLSSLLCAGVSHAGAPLPDPSGYPTYHIALAYDPAATAGYALVPNDSPVLLPLTAWSDVPWGVSFPEVPILETVTLTVEGDPAGAVTAYAWRELTWTPGAAREFGRSYTASLAAGVASQGLSPVFYAASSFEFSYFDGTSAELLPLVELTLSDVQETQGPLPHACCEVDAALCAEASSCFQCWDQTAALSVYPVWTGSGLAYLSLETEPRGFAQVLEFGETCIQGTASAAGETRSLSVCHTVTEWPSVEVYGRQTVFADTCKVMPEGYFPLTRLFVVRGETEAEALQLLEPVEPVEPAEPVTPRKELDPEREPFQCGLGSRPVESKSLPWLAVLALLGAVSRRRQHLR